MDILLLSSSFLSNKTYDLRNAYALKIFLIHMAHQEYFVILYDSWEHELKILSLKGIVASKAFANHDILHNIRRTAYL